VIKLNETIINQIWTNITNLTANSNYTGIDKCMTQAHAYSTECLYRTLCPQFNHYFVNMGLGIIIFVIVLSWLKWWYLTKGYTRFGYSIDSSLTKWIGNIYHIETRQKIDVWINARVQKLLIGFIVVMVYLSWGA